MLYTHIRIPAIHNQLFAYRLTLTSELNRNSPTSGFQPILRQSFPWSVTPESKFHIINDGHDDGHDGDQVLSRPVRISFHGRPAFMPPPNNPPEGLLLQLWLDSDRYVGAVVLRLNVDWYGSLNQIVSRYYMSMLCFPLVTALFVGAQQAKTYFHDGMYRMELPRKFIGFLETF